MLATKLSLDFEKLDEADFVSWVPGLVGHNTGGITEFLDKELRAGDVSARQFLANTRSII